LAKVPLQVNAYIYIADRKPGIEISIDVGETTRPVGYKSLIKLIDSDLDFSQHPNKKELDQRTYRKLHSMLSSALAHLEKRNQGKAHAKSSR